MAWKTKNTNMFFEFSHLNAETMKFVEILRHGNGESNSGAKGNNVSSKEMEHQEGAPSGRISLQEMRSLRAPCNRPDCKDIQNKINEIFAEVCFVQEDNKACLSYIIFYIEKRNCLSI